MQLDLFFFVSLFQRLFAIATQNFLFFDTLKICISVYFTILGLNTLSIISESLNQTYCKVRPRELHPVNAIRERSAPHQLYWKIMKPLCSKFSSDVDLKDFQEIFKWVETAQRFFFPFRGRLLVNTSVSWEARAKRKW